MRSNRESRYTGAGRNEVRSRIIGLIAEITIVAAFALLVYTCLFGVTMQRGNDMYPAIRDGDIVVYYRRGDLLPTQSVVYETGGESRTGRVAACGGSEIGVTGDGHLTVNGIMLPAMPESGIMSDTLAEDPDAAPVIIDSGAYYILNDDRTRMTDSRTYGQIGRDNIRGRIVAVFRIRQI